MIAYVLLLVEISEVRKILRERKGRLKKRRIFFKENYLSQNHLLHPVSIPYVRKGID